MFFLEFFSCFIQLNLSGLSRCYFFVKFVLPFFFPKLYIAIHFSCFFSPHLFSNFVREQNALGLEAAVKKITLDTANIWGLNDRGQLREGFAADVTVFDPETIDRGPEYYVQDVPGDGSRYVRDAMGVDTVVIGGEVAYSTAGGYTDSRRGQVLPGPAG